MKMRLVVPAFAATLLLSLAACGNLNRVPRYDVDAGLMPDPFKRYATYDEQDFVNRFRAEAWYPRTGEIEEPVSADMADVLDRHGLPEYVRYRFKAESNELVDQWAYWDRGVTVQFVQGMLVWEGDLTDMDRYLIKHGYPQKAIYSDPVTGARRDVFDYHGILQTPRRQVTFTNEKLISEFRY